jgi:hypothetical protein
MSKIIRITESKLIDIIQKIMLNQSIISEVEEVDDFDKDFPEYNYSSIKVLPSRKNPNEIGTVFFNGKTFGRSEYHDPEYNTIVKLNGPLGEFEFDSGIVNYNGYSPYVFGNDLNHSDYYKLLPLMAPTKTQVSLDNITSSSDNITSSLDEIKSQDIRDSLKMAFPEYWENETEDYTAGLRGIHTIGEKMDNDSETWSIMNFFDTRTIPTLINAKWKKEGSGNKVEWLSSVFQNDDEFLDELLTKQWGSVYNGFFKNEESTMSNLKKMFNDPNVKFKTYPFGHKMDRYGGVDVEIYMPGEETPMTIQIKPMEKTERLSNGDIKVYTNGMSNDYESKRGLGFILYNKGNRFIMFKNKNYDVIPLSNGKEVIHRDKPFRVF